MHIGTARISIEGPARTSTPNGMAVAGGFIRDAGREARFSPNVVALARALLDALDSTCRRAPFHLALVDDGEFEVLAVPHSVAGGEWDVSLSSTAKGGKTQDRLILDLVLLFGQLERACHEGSLSLEDLLAGSPSDFGLQAASDA